MYKKNASGVTQLFCDCCGKAIVGIAWGTVSPPANYCSEPCRKQGKQNIDQGEIPVAKRKTAKKAPATKRGPAKKEPEVVAAVEPIVAETVVAETTETVTETKPKRTFKLPDDTEVNGMPTRSPFTDEHQTKMFKLLKSCKTVGEFREKMKTKGLYRGIQDAHFCNTLYALVRAGLSEG